VILIDVRVSHAVEPQIAKNRFGDQAQPLRPPRQRRHHQQRRERHLDPGNPFVILDPPRGVGHRFGSRL
jgi:hypothetical protein